MNNIVMKTDNQLSAITPEIWSRRYYDVLLAALVFRDSISDDYEGDIQNLGDTVNVSQFPEFSDADVIAEGQANDADSVSVNQIQLVINKRVAKDFIISNKAMTQSLPAMDKLKELAGYSIMKKIEKELIALIVPSASAPDHQIAYDSGTTLALADILEGKELLDAADVPLSDRIMIMGPAQLNDIFAIQGFTSSDFIVSGAPLQTGELPPALLGFQPRYTSLAGDTTYLFHRSFMQIAAQRGMSVVEYDLGVNGVRGVRVNSDTLLGYKQFADDRVVTIG